MEPKEVIDRLSGFVYIMARDGVECHDDYAEWSTEREQAMADCFGYCRTDGMPAIRHLVNPHFHPNKPLIGLNYTPLAHNTLFRYPDGWTWPLRYSRGIVFEDTGKLVALPFYKFFNYGEHPETRKLPDTFCLATEKHDGHLGIIYRYGGRFDLTTRGSFTSPSAVIGRRLMKGYSDRFHWSGYGELDVCTLLTEIIHPQTHVIRGYGSAQKLILIGGFNHLNVTELTYDQLCVWGRKLGMPVAKAWKGTDAESVLAMVNDPSIKNREGCVARYGNGLRVKFKFRDYIRIMKERKLSYSRLMRHACEGSLETYMDGLPEELLPEALEMLELIQRCRGVLPYATRVVYLKSLLTEAEIKNRGSSVCTRYAKLLEH